MRAKCNENNLTSYGVFAMMLYYGIMVAAKALGMDSSNSMYYGMFAIALSCLIVKYFLTSYSRREIAIDVLLVGIGLVCYACSGDMTLLLLAITVVGLSGCDFFDCMKTAFAVRVTLTSMMIIGSFLGVFDQGETAQVTTSFQDITVYDFGYSTANNAYVNIFLLVVVLLYFAYERIDWKWFGIMVVLAMLMYTFTNSRTGTMLFFVMWMLIFCEKFFQGKKIRTVFFGALRWMPLICAAFSLFCAVAFRMDGSYFSEYVNRIFSGRLNITHQYYEALGVSLFPRSSRLMDSLRGIGFIDNVYMSVFFHNGLLVGLVVLGLILISNGILYRNRCYRELVFVATFSVYGIMEEFPLNPIVNPFMLLVGLAVYKSFTLGGRTMRDGLANAARLACDGMCDETRASQNVLLVHNHYKIAGGEDSVVANEMKLLKDNGHRVVLYERSNGELDDIGFWGKILLPFTSIFSLRTYREVRHMIGYYDIDVVHVHNTLTMVSPSVYYAAFRENVPVVQTMHNFRLLCPGGSFYREDAGEYGIVCEECATNGLQCALKGKCYRGSLAQTLVSAAILKIHRILGTYGRLDYICLTEFNRSKLMLLNTKRRVIDPARVHLKPNMVPDLRKLPEPGNAISGNCQPQESESYYVYVGRLEPLKGTRLLIEAFLKMPEVRLKVLGDGPDMDWVKSTISAHNATNIELLGRRTGVEYATILKNARALVTTSQCYETFGMSIGEAYSLGVPVIAGDMGNLGNLVLEGVTGLHYAYNVADGDVSLEAKSVHNVADGDMTLEAKSGEGNCAALSGRSPGLVQAVKKFDALCDEELAVMKTNARRFYEDRLDIKENYTMLKAVYDGCTGGADENLRSMDGRQNITENA